MGHITLYNDQDRAILLRTAKESIQYGLMHRDIMFINLPDYSETLRQRRGCFVTLETNGRLRGCIGTLEAQLPLINDVVKNAFLSAFRDPRFPPLVGTEFPNIDLTISVLSTTIPMQFSSEEDLLQQLRPGIDGLILSDNGHRGTFLPSVWEQLSEPKDFLNHLKIKAGLPVGYWSNTVHIDRYTTELIS